MIKIVKIGTPPKQLTEASILFGLSAKPGAKMKNVESLLEEVLQKTGDVAEGYFDDIMATWGNTYQHEKGVTKKLTKGSDWVLYVYVIDDIFAYLNEGTTKRAKMQPGFQRKTGDVLNKYGDAEYKSGVGSPPFEPYKYKDGHPVMTRGGIKARNWTTSMAKDLEPIMKQRLDAAFSGVGRIT